MAVKKVTVDTMASAIMEGLTDYADLATEDMKEEVKKTGASLRKEIQRNAPKDSGAYTKSWTVKKTEESANTLTLTVHSKNRYQLTHLLEHGHAKRDGGRVAGKPHIAPAEQKAVKQLAENIERRLKNG